MGSPVRADRIDPVEVRQLEDVEQLGASSRREGLEPLAQRLLHLVEGHGQTLTRRADRERPANRVAAAQQNEASQHVKAERFDLHSF